MKESLLIGGGGVLCLLGALATGTAFMPVTHVGNPDPSSTFQAPMSSPQPGAFFQLASGLALIGVGGGAIASGCRKINNQEQQDELYQQIQNLGVQDTRNLAIAAPSQEIQSYQNDMSEVPQTVPSTAVHAPTKNCEVVAQDEAPVVPTTTSIPIPEVKYQEPPGSYTVGPPTYDYSTYLYQEHDTTDSEVKPCLRASEESTPDVWHEPPQEEYEEVMSLVAEGNVGIVGAEKGSGKTSKLGWLIGEHIKQGHLVWMVNPFAAGKEFKGIKVWGRGYDFNQAAQGIKDWTAIAIKRMRMRGDETLDYDPFDDIHIHLALDEMSNYGRKLDEIDPTIMAEFWETSIQFIRQMNMSISFATHGDTQGFLGGEKALKSKSETIKNGITWLYARAKTDTSVRGNKRCAGWAEYVRYYNGQRQSKRINIPEWMQGPPNYDYRELVQKHCPQFLYVPTAKSQEGKGKLITFPRPTVPPSA